MAMDVECALECFRDGEVVLFSLLTCFQRGRPKAEINPDISSSLRFEPQTARLPQLEATKAQNTPQLYHPQSDPHQSLNRLLNSSNLISNVTFTISLTHRAYESGNRNCRIWGNPTSPLDTSRILRSLASPPISSLPTRYPRQPRHTRYNHPDHDSQRALQRASEQSDGLTGP